MTGTLPLQTQAEIDAKPQPDDLTLWSVTTILEATGSEKGLVEWSGKGSARGAVRNLDTVRSMLHNQGEDETVRWIMQRRYDRPKGERSITARGSAVHAAIEILTVTGKRPTLGTPLGGKLGVYDAELVPFMDSFEMFLDKFSPHYTAAEMTVYNFTYGYAGTLDGIADNRIIDYKTGDDLTDSGERKGPWKTVGMQLAGYWGAEQAAIVKARKYEQRWGHRYYLLNQQEQVDLIPMPKTVGAWCIHIAPHHCDIYEIVDLEQAFERFLYAIEAARTDFEYSNEWLQPVWLMDRSA
jgi:hypothetical protein